MTTRIKLQPALPKGAGISDAFAGQLYEQLGSHHVALVELQVTERTEVADDEDKEPSASLSIVSIEFAAGEQDADLLRRAIRARYEARTALGTLDETTNEAMAQDTMSASYLQALTDVISSSGKIGDYPATATITKDGKRMTITVVS